MITTIGPVDLALFDDSELAGLASCFDSSQHNHEVADPLRLLERRTALMTKTTQTIAIPASELPASELPDFEPTDADLLAIELLDDTEFGDDEFDARFTAANALLAFQHRHDELLRLRADLPGAALIDEDFDLSELERVA